MSRCVVTAVAGGGVGADRAGGVHERTAGREEVRREFVCEAG